MTFVNGFWDKGGRIERKCIICKMIWEMQASFSFFYLDGLRRPFTTVEATRTATNSAPATTPACNAGDSPPPSEDDAFDEDEGTEKSATAVLTMPDTAPVTA